MSAVSGSEKALKSNSQAAADETKLHEIARDLLSNPVIEDYRLEMVP